MELRKIYGKWDTGGKYWHRIETTGGKSLKRPRFTTDCRATKEEEVCTYKQSAHTKWLQ
jgi:hypothetical protein